jgi:hypothetical protein
MQHPWNQRVIQLLTAEFKSNVKACKYQVLTSLPPECDGEDFVLSAIGSKLSRRQSILRATIRKMTQASNLSSAEIAELLTKEYKESLIRSRRNERRRNVSHPIMICHSLLSYTESYTFGAATLSKTH